MKIILDRNKFNLNVEHFLRRNGYAFIVDRRRGAESFVRTMGSGHYPRFHIYIKREDDRVVLDIHLDQKQASYAGSHMHNAEYDGEVVEAEIKRLKGLILKEYQNVSKNNKVINIKEKEGLVKRFLKSFFEIIEK